jgi:hypothetical protein
VVADTWPLRQMHLVEAGSWRTVHSLQRNEGAWATWTPTVSITRDGQKLAVAGNANPGNPDPQIEIWDVPGEQLLHRLPAGFSTDAGVAFSQDGRYLLNQAMQGTRIYETTSFSVVDEFSGLGWEGNSGSFLPGTPLVAVSLQQQGRILVRDYQKHETVAVLKEAATGPRGLCSGRRVSGHFRFFRSEPLPVRGGRRVPDPSRSSSQRARDRLQSRRQRVGLLGQGPDGGHVGFKLWPKNLGRRPAAPQPRPSRGV